MFAPTNIEETRQFLSHAWRQFQQKAPLTDLEAQICRIIAMHPEYYAYFEQVTALNESDTDNPYLHISLHLALAEQVSTDRPAGIHQIYTTLCETQDLHEAEHQMMQVLCDYIGQCMENGQEVDDSAYLDKLKALTPSALFIKAD